MSAFPITTDLSSFQPPRTLVRRLAELARPDAVAVEGAGGITIRLKSRKSDMQSAARRLDETEVAQLTQAGWLAAFGTPGARHWQLTDGGRSRLRAIVLKSDDRENGSRARRKRKVALDAGPQMRPQLLDVLHARKDAKGVPLISAEHVAAGERLGEDFHRASLQPRVTQSWDAAAYAARAGFSGQGGVGERDASVQAYARVQRALDAVGSDAAGLVLDICCFDIGLAQAERDRMWNEGTARIVLRMALQRLAEHYGIVVRRPADLHRYIRHWADGAYRPEIGSRP